MSGSARVGILGGTFDPIHLGHLAVAAAARDALRLDRLLFVPSLRPPHRPDSPAASGYHRWQMTALAVADERGWQASDVELRREGASYTYDTLTTLKEAEPGSQFFFITGADAFAEIATWWRYPDVLDLASFVVIARPGTSIDRLRARLPALGPRMVAVSSAAPEPEISRSFSPIFLVSVGTPEISSTDIRLRVSRGASLSGLVPDAVATYIAAHRLYV